VPDDPGRVAAVVLEARKAGQHALLAGVPRALAVEGGWLRLRTAAGDANAPRPVRIGPAEAPMLAVPALNAPEPDWPELGLRILEPGEEMRLDMRIEVRVK